jgi:hypothetical protein
MTMTPEDLINELWRKVVLARDEPELEGALDELQSALQQHRDHLESLAADYFLNLPLAIRKRVSTLHEKIAA